MRAMHSNCGLWRTQMQLPTTECASQIHLNAHQLLVAFDDFQIHLSVGMSAASPRTPNPQHAPAITVATRTDAQVSQLSTSLDH